MKKLCLIPVVAVFVLLFAVGASAALLGDVNGSGAVDPADARLALRAAVRLETAFLPGTKAFAAADVDFNGTITSADARSILRASVALEDLSDRLPESAALSEKALSEKINGSIVEFFVCYGKNIGGPGMGLVIDADGTVVVPYRLIRRMTAIEVLNRPECRVESVLMADPESDLALLKVSGDWPYLPVNRSRYGVGDRVYSMDCVNALHRLTVTAPSADASASLPAHAVCARIPEEEYLFDLISCPMVDRFGRAIGLILEDRPVGGVRTAVAAPLSLLPAPDAYAPRTVEEFSRDEWRIMPECPVEAFSLVLHGTGLIPVYAPGWNHGSVHIENPRPDCLEVFRSPAEPEGAFLVIQAKKPCRDVPVTVRFEGPYESAEVAVTISVTEDGYVNLAGAECFPDPGVIWESTPSDLSVGEALTFSFRKSALSLTDEELFYAYTDTLMEMGYEYVGTEQYVDGNVYRFRWEEYDATVEYWDYASSVSILCGFGEPENGPANKALDERDKLAVCR